MKIIKILLVSFSLLFVQQVFACGGWYYSSYYNVYLIQNMMHDGTLGLTYHNNRTEFDGNATEDNLKEWKAFFGDKYSQETLSELIYTQESNANKTKIYSSLNKSMQFEKDAFVKYMEFAKQCEEIALANDDPWDYEENHIDYVKINSLINEAKAEIKKSNNVFYKERYVFQLIKMHYYGENYDEAIKTYIDFFEKNDTKTVLKYWALNYKAGALKQSGDFTNANYNFLQSFINYSGGRHKAYFSMTFNNQLMFDNTLSLCKSNEEKAAFYFIRGVNNKSVVIEDLKKVLELAPNSEYAKILLANEIVKMEHSYWSKEEDQDWWYDDTEKIETNQLKNYIQEFIPLVEKAAKQNTNKVFWNISLAYLNTLNKDYTASSNILKAINTTDKFYIKQKQAIELLNYTLSHENLSIANENELGSMWYKYNNDTAKAYDDIYSWSSEPESINRLVADLLNEKYKNKNDFKSLLFGREDLISYRGEYNSIMKIENVQKLRAEIKNTDKTILLKYGVDLFLAGQSSFENLDRELDELEATLYMRNPENLSKAVALFEKSGISTPLKTNPFNMEIRDCIWGDWGDENSCNHKPTKYTKASFAKKLEEIKQIADSLNSAMDYFLLGNAYYNMTYYGPNWEALSYSRSGSYTTGFADCSIALNFYKKAIQLFNNDKEMQAKATFMAAKCEQNIYYNTVYEMDKWTDPIEWDWQNPKQGIINYNNQAAAAGYKTYFNSLEKDFKDTQYYQEIINECSYFDIYVSN